MHRTAMEEAARCLLCYDAPCSKGCPAGTDPAKFIRSIRFRNPKGAAETIRENNILGGTCARVCPTGDLCEEACSRCGIDRPIEIGKLQRYAVEQEKTFKMKILKAPAKKKAGKVACVGAGPASLACAAELAKTGYRVTVQYALSLGIGTTTNMAPAELLGESKLEYAVFNGRDGKSGMKISADAIVFATGQKAEDLSKIMPMALNEKGWIKADAAGKTSIEKVFAGGDAVNGGGTVVEAVRAGKDAAASIIAYLEKRGVKQDVN